MSEFVGPCLRVVLLCWASIVACACSRQQQIAPPTDLADVPVPMRDGTVLRADLWRPTAHGRFPTLIYRTPYGKGPEEAYNQRTFKQAVAHGYALLIQDVRGRYASAGEFSPYVHEGKDGYDTVEWAARQSWSNGNVGLLGVSYAGATQWLAAIESPPSLRAMVPAMSFSSARHFVYFGGVFETAWAGWIHDEISADARARQGLRDARKQAATATEYERLGMGVFVDPLPMLTMDLLSEVAPFYYEWLRTPPEDPAWDWGEIRAHYAQVGAAVLNLSGWHDEAYGPAGAIDGFQGLVAARQGATDVRTKLVLGPWIHGAYETELSRVGERELGPAARINYDDLVLGWLDHYLQGRGDTWVARQAPVRAFVMGDNRWRSASEWPLHETRYQSLYLGRTDAGGTLTWSEPRGQAQSRFTADPQHPVRDERGTNFGAHDLRWLAQRSDVLTFDSEVLDRDLEVTGPIKAEIYASSDAPDFDLYVLLLDLGPDGTAYNLMSPGQQVLRASYRFQGKPRRLLAPGEVAKLELDHGVTANTFLRGHRMRVCICASWYPLYARNLQTGESEVFSGQTRVAHIEVHHQGRGYSRLVLPVIPREE